MQGLKDFRLHPRLAAVLSGDSHGGVSLGALQLQVFPLLYVCSSVSQAPCFPLSMGILKSFCSVQLPSEVLLETRCVGSARHPAWIFSNRSLGLPCDSWFKRCLFFSVGFWSCGYPSATRPENTGHQAWALEITASVLMGLPPPGTLVECMHVYVGEWLKWEKMEESSSRGTGVWYAEELPVVLHNLSLVLVLRPSHPAGVARWNCWLLKSGGFCLPFLKNKQNPKVWASR